jgi:chromatin remodeling complex protein RSC6
MKPAPIPPEAKNFIQEIGESIPDNNLLLRTELSRYIYDYIKTNNLYKQDSSKVSGYNKMVIVPDDKIKTLFSLNDGQTLNFVSMNVNLAILYRRMFDKENQCHFCYRNNDNCECPPKNLENESDSDYYDY